MLKITNIETMVWQAPANAMEGMEKWGEYPAHTRFSRYPEFAKIMGLHSRGNDLTVNPTKGKQLTNVRASGTDEALTLTPPVRHTLEQALEFIEDDELVEVTPISIRLRKKLLQEHERRRAGRI